MKKIKKILYLFVAFIMCLDPITLVAQSSNNEKQIKNRGGETVGDGVKISKTIAPTELENYFDITLKVQTQEEAKSQDIAVVLVMDVSNTMIQNYLSAGNEPKTGNKPKTRLKAALDASTEFLKSFGKNSDGINAKRKIGFVAFNSNGHILQSMTDCKTETKGMSIAESVLAKTKQITKEIEKPDPEGYGKDPTRFTNIQAGLQVANDLLYNNSEIKNIQNKYIIFLSDGYPTTYSIEGTYIGHNTKNPDSRYLHDDITNRPLIYGTNYSDRSASKAEEIAKTLRNKGVTIYSIGTGIDNNFETIPEYEAKMTSSFSTIDRYDINYYNKYNYKVGKPSTASTPEKRKQEDLQSFRQWLGGKDSTTTTKIGDGIGSGYGSGHYFDVAKDIQEMQKAFTDIFEDIKYLSEASWVAEDPMNSNQSTVKDVIKFVGLYDKSDDKNKLKDSITYDSSLTDIENTSNNTANYNNTDDKINWDLKKSKYQKETINNVTYYNYEIKYRIRLKNEASGFKANQIFDTNGKTTLSYVVRESGKNPRIETIDFKIPQVEGYLGKLEFNKVSNYKVSNYGNKPLSGAKFILVHDHDNCPCQKERKYMDKNYQLTSTSNEEGKVIFTNIPSGHKYKLKEVETDEYHNIDTTEYQVTVSYGNTSTNILNKQIVNNYKTKNLIIKKVIDGTISNQEFNFEIEATYQNAPLVGTYTIQRKLGRNININTENIEFIDGKATFKLKHNEEIKIIDLPYKINYKINEIDTDGFIVKYQVNGTQFDNNNLLVLKEDNTVVVTNISGYLLPATGSSSMLILGIIGVFLLGIPIVYITLNVLTKRLIIKH